MENLMKQDWLHSYSEKGTFINAEYKEKEREAPNGFLDWQLSVQDYLTRSQFA
jgi:hypothetical protein